jgi:hypothetical protein
LKQSPNWQRFGLFAMHTSDKRGAKIDELQPTPLELIDRIAILVPSPRTHRHRYFCVLAPNSSLRSAVTAQAQGASASPTAAQVEQAWMWPLARMPARFERMKACESGLHTTLCADPAQTRDQFESRPQEQAQPCGLGSSVYGDHLENCRAINLGAIALAYAFRCLESDITLVFGYVGPGQRMQQYLLTELEKHIQSHSGYCAKP